MLLKVPASLWNVVLGLVAWIAVSWMITADQASEQPPDALAYFWAFGLGALMLVRRRYPLIVLWVTVVTLLAYYMAGYPAVGLSIPLAAALLSAAEFRKLYWPILAAVALLGISYAVRIAQGQDLSRIVGYELAGEVGLMAAAMALGVSLRLRRQLQTRSAELVQATIREQRSQAHADQDAQRAAMARELHDSLGHQATVVSMYADVAKETIQHNRSVTNEALDIVSSTSSEMLTELRQTVKTLRGGGSDRTVTTLETLNEQVIEPLPLDVRVHIDPSPGEHQLSYAVQTAAYRIVQESLTNVLRHSAAQKASVTIEQQDDQLVITVSDTGPPRVDGTSAEPGAGITGMAERAASLNGWFRAGSHDEGFIVQAALPVERGVSL